VLGLIGNTGDDLVEDFLVDHKARASAAALPMIEEDGSRRAGNELLGICIVEHDHRRFAAEFKRDFLQATGSRLDDQFAETPTYVLPIRAADKYQEPSSAAE
jgi:hypothetical protein